MKTKTYEFTNGEELIECLVGECYAQGQLATDSDIVYRLRQLSFIPTNPKAEFYVLDGKLQEAEEKE